VFLYYKLTNFYQNHRRYVKSVDTSQLHGDAVSASDLNGGDCKPITSSPDGRPYYPCGLIANSVFNDSYSQPILLNAANGATQQTYNFTDKGITWSNEAKKYKKPGYASPSEVSPPPNWAEKYPQGYTEFPDLAADEHLQVWMRTAGLPTFRKLFFRNDQETMAKGIYRIEAYMSQSQSRFHLPIAGSLTLTCCIIHISLDYPVKQFSGTKSIVISTVSWIGGKNVSDSATTWSLVTLWLTGSDMLLCAELPRLRLRRRRGDLRPVRSRRDCATSRQASVRTFGLRYAFVQGLSSVFRLQREQATDIIVSSPCPTRRRLGDMSLLSWNQPTAGGR
jgi:hypothetical protein